MPDLCATCSAVSPQVEPCVPGSLHFFGTALAAKRTFLASGGLSGLPDPMRLIWICPVQNVGFPPRVNVEVHAGGQTAQYKPTLEGTSSQCFYAFGGSAPHAAKLVLPYTGSGWY